MKLISEYFPLCYHNPIHFTPVYAAFVQLLPKCRIFSMLWTRQ